MLNQIDIFWLSVSVGFFAWMLGCFVWVWRGCPEPPALGKAEWIALFDSDDWYNMGVIVDEEIVWDARVRRDLTNTILDNATLEIYSGVRPALPTDKPTGELIGKIYFGAIPPRSQTYWARRKERYERPLIWYPRESEP